MYKTQQKNNVCHRKSRNCVRYLYKTKAAQPSSCGIIHAIYNTRESSCVDFKADPVPDPDFYLNADPDLDPGQTFDFLLEKYS
jgi:hypothetical protein